MAGEFKIEALEPRQFLSCSPAPAPQPATTITSATVLPTPAGYSASAPVTIPATTTLSAAPQSTPAFSRPGDGGSTDAISAPPVGGRFQWGSDIYPPHVISTTTGATTSVTQTTSATTTTAPAIPPTVVIIGRRRGVAGHFTVQRGDIVVHLGRSTGVSTQPKIVSQTTLRAPQSPAFAVPSSSQPSRRPTLRGSSAVTISPVGPASPHVSTFAGEHLSVIGNKSTAIGAIRTMPALVPQAYLTAPAENASSIEPRAFRILRATGLSSLLLPLATMETETIGSAGATVSKWEVDLAIGSLLVGFAGYWYLCDAAAHRRRQRALAVSIFSDQPIE